ncbi:MAG: UDP-2,3-diacylglucosamine diphosphatase LpxI [Terrimicrobiaceae bacterium]
MLVIAGSGRYPALVIEEARRAGVGSIFVAAFTNETPESTAALADRVEWVKVGQLGRLLRFAASTGARRAIMAGQIAPRNLFDLRPDLQAIMILAKLKRRNAETIFGAVADRLSAAGITLLPATTFLDDHMATPGLIAGPQPKPRVLEDIAYGREIARETSRLDIGQSVVVRHGTVLAVEAFEGTDACIRRGGELGRGQAVLVKVTKPGQDMRFDVPVIGSRTLETAHQSGVSVIAVESGRTLLLDKPSLAGDAANKGISLYGIS